MAEDKKQDEVPLVIEEQPQAEEHVSEAEEEGKAKESTLKETIQMIKESASEEDPKPRGRPETFRPAELAYHTGWRPADDGSSPFADLVVRANRGLLYCLCSLSLSVSTGHDCH